MDIRGVVVLGLASCGAYAGGGGRECVSALQDLRATDGNRPHRAHGSGRSIWTGTVAGFTSAAALIGLAVCAHPHCWSSLRHIWLLLTGHGLRLVARDPLLAGSVLCVVAVVAFTVVVMMLAGPGDVSGVTYPRILVGAFARSTRPVSQRLEGTRRPRRGAGRRRCLARRPPTFGRYRRRSHART